MKVDAELQQQLCRVVADPTLLCPHGGPVKEICLESNCGEMPAFSSDCELCTNAHETCNGYRMSVITKLLTKRSATQETILKKMFFVEDELVSMIKKRREMVAEEIFMGNLEEN